MNSNKSKYRNLCSNEITIPLFSMDWWLDATVGSENWDVAIVEKDSKIVASFPYVKQKKGIFTLLNMPKFTPYLGIWIKYPSGQKYTNRLSYEKEIINELINQLPQFDYFSQRFYYNFTNWLPFYWKNFIQTTKYTYVLKDLLDIDKVFLSFRSNIKTDIRKAEKHMKVYSNNNINDFCDLYESSHVRKGVNILRSIDLIKKIEGACGFHNCRKMFFCKDEDNHIHGGIYIVWDAKSCYYLMSNRNTNYKNIGATSLLIWEAIKFSSSMNKEFNFEGSMVEPIERFFRAFGAEQTPYFWITRTDSRILLLREALIKFFKI